MAGVTDLNIQKEASSARDCLDRGDDQKRVPLKRGTPVGDSVMSAIGKSAPTLVNPRPRQKRTMRRGGAASPLVAGRELGPYALLEILGRGAQGDVWKAARLDSRGELVALKVLRPGLKNDPARMAQFRREAERGTRLAGPSLLKVFALGECDGHIFMAMPYVAGLPLAEVVRRRRDYLAGDHTDTNHGFACMKSDEYRSAMIKVLARVARALARVHDQLIAHRDIKPANILLHRLDIGAAYLCDFGLGRDLDIATAAQMRDGAGSPMYMAPERLLRLPADEVKCDIYSLGATIFEAMTLTRPFVVPDHLGPALLAPYLAGSRPRRPSEICPNFPHELEAIIMKAMARQAWHRFHSARELALDLERCGLRLSIRFDRTPAREPRHLLLTGISDGSAGRRAQLPTARPAAVARDRVKLAARSVTASDLERDSRAG